LGGARPSALQSGRRQRSLWSNDAARPTVSTTTSLGATASIVECFGLTVSIAAIKTPCIIDCQRILYERVPPDTLYDGRYSNISVTCSTTAFHTLNKNYYDLRRVWCVNLRKCFVRYTATGGRPRGWPVSFSHSPAIAQITVSAVPPPPPFR
jgi:hypothetical protein